LPGKKILKKWKGEESMTSEMLEGSDSYIPSALGGKGN